MGIRDKKKQWVSEDFEGKRKRKKGKKKKKKKEKEKKKKGNIQ